MTQISSLPHIVRSTAAEGTTNKCVAEAFKTKRSFVLLFSDHCNSTVTVVNRHISLTRFSAAGFSVAYNFYRPLKSITKCGQFLNFTLVLTSLLCLQLGPVAVAEMTSAAVSCRLTARTLSRRTHICTSGQRHIHPYCRRHA